MPSTGILEGPQTVLSAGLSVASAYPDAADQVVSPIFLIRTRTVPVPPVNIEIGKPVPSSMRALFTGEDTVTATFAEAPPNQPFPSAHICLWKLYVPGLPGALSVTGISTASPGGTARGRTVLLAPQIVESVGFCEPSQ